MTEQWPPVIWPKIPHDTAPIVVAVSGGVDSMVLLDLAKRQYGARRLIVAHVNYHLRGEASQADAQLVRQTAQQMGAHYEQKDWAATNSSGLEAQARTVRYQFFVETAQRYGATHLLIAHQQDERLETAWLQMSRSGQLGQSLLYPQRAFEGMILARPLLKWSKKQLYAYAQAHGLQWREDATNEDATYTPRNRIRHQLLPLVDTLNPKARQHWDQVLDQIALQEQLITQQADYYLADIQQQKRTWLDIPSDWRAPVIRLWLKQQQQPVKDKQVQQINALFESEVKPQGCVRLSEDWAVRRVYGQLLLENVKIGQKSQHTSESMLKLDYWQSYGNYAFQLTSVPQQDGHLSLDQQQLPLQLRAVEATDTLPLQQGHQRIRRLFVNEKVPNDQRKRAFVLLDAQRRVLAVFWPNGWKVAAHTVLDQINKKQNPVYLHWRIEEDK